MAIDDNTIYGLYGSQIKDLPDKINAVKGMAKVLTTADYNIKSGTWRTSDPTTFDAVALWLMPSGFYSLTDNNLPVYIDRSNRIYNIPSGGKAILVLNAQGNNKIILVPSGSSRMYVCYTSEAGYGTEVSGNLDSRTVLTRYEIEDSLTSDDKDRTLSAKQGKALKDFIGDLANLTTTDKSNLVAAINEAAAGGGGGIIELTSADYNYPTDNPTQIAAWLLPDGIYHSASTAIQWSAYGDSAPSGTFIKTTNSSNMAFVFFYRDNGLNEVILSQAISAAHYTNLSTSAVKQTTGTSTTDVMSQNAVTSMVFTDPSARKRVQIGNGATSADDGCVGIGYLAKAQRSRTTAIGYNSTTSNADSTVIGYNASSLGQYSTVLGGEANQPAWTNYGTALGYHASASGLAAVALGSYSSATQQGQMDISTGSRASDGYNSSNYRLLTGLYDPQSAHDAATKGYVDNSLLGKQDALTAGDGITIADESGSLVISTTVAEPDEFTSSEWNALWS